MPHNGTRVLTTSALSHSEITNPFVKHLEQKQQFPAFAEQEGSLNTFKDTLENIFL